MESGFLPAEKEKLETPLETPSLPAPSVDVEKKTPGVEKRTPSIEKKTPDVGELSERQKKILKILEKEKEAQVWNFTKFFPDVSKRTLRRDLDNLLKKELIIRVGKWNQVFYQLKGGRTEIGQGVGQDK